MHIKIKFKTQNITSIKKHPEKEKYALLLSTHILCFCTNLRLVEFVIKDYDVSQPPATSLLKYVFSFNTSVEELCKQNHKSSESRGK